MQPNEAMKAMARRIMLETIPHHDYAGRGVAYDAALAAIMETQEACAKYAGWAHMVPPDGGSPTAEETQLAASIASGTRAGEHYALAGEDIGGGRG